MAETTTYTGGCHCGTVRYRATMKLEGAVTCNCSICSKTGSMLAFVPAAQFELTAGADALTDYQWGKKKIHHLFCKRCGVRSFARGARPTSTSAPSRSSLSTVRASPSTLERSRLTTSRRGRGSLSARGSALATRSSGDPLLPRHEEEVHPVPRPALLGHEEIERQRRHVVRERLERGLLFDVEELRVGFAGRARLGLHVAHGQARRRGLFALELVIGQPLPLVAGGALDAGVVPLRAAQAADEVAQLVVAEHHAHHRQRAADGAAVPGARRGGGGELGGEAGEV